MSTGTRWEEQPSDTMTLIKRTLGVVLLVIACVALAMVWRRPAAAPRHGVILVNHPPRIHPEYEGVTIPPNIAPLNFVVDEPGDAYEISLRGVRGKPVIVRSRSAAIWSCAAARTGRSRRTCQGRAAG